MLNESCVFDRKQSGRFGEKAKDRERDSKEQTASARNGTRKAKNQNHRPVLHNTHLIGSLLKLPSMTQMWFFFFLITEK